MNTFSGTSSDGFLPTSMSATSVGTTAVAPEPQDSSATFADVLEQEQGGSPALWPGVSSAKIAQLSPAASTSLVIADPAVSALSVATFLISAPAMVEATPSLSATVAAPAFAAAALSDTTTRAGDPQADLPHYVWLRQPKPPVVPVAPDTTLETAPRKQTPPIPMAILSAAGDSDAAPGSALLTLAQYLQLAQPPKPVTAVPPAATDSAPDTTNETTTASTDFPLQNFSWFSGSKSLPVSTSAAAADRMPVADNEPDITSAAIVGSLMNRAPSMPFTAPVAQPVPPEGVPLQPIVFDSASSSESFDARRSPLATNMAHVAVLAATSNQSTATNSATSTLVALDDEAKGSPTVAAQLSGLTKGSVVPSGGEKKSPVSPSERSSIPATAKHQTASDTNELLQAELAAALNLSVNQPVATTSSTLVKTADAPGTTPVGSAGTTNDKNQADMTSTLEMQSAFVSSGTHPLVTRADADLHIKLGTNSDFHHALDQVMHVAELSNLSRVTPPLRVAIEIQTPPGAIVSVYISRQPDSSYRAQLSTSDVQALGWVQEQVGALKETTDAGTAIRWSPAQLDSTLSTAGADSSANDHGLDWNRGGQQGQSGYQDDERELRRRPVYARADEAESLGFFETITALGGAA